MQKYPNHTHERHRDRKCNGKQKSVQKHSEDSGHLRSETMNFQPKTASHEMSYLLKTDLARKSLLILLFSGATSLLEGHSSGHLGNSYSRSQNRPTLEHASEDSRLQRQDRMAGA